MGETIAGSPPREQGRFVRGHAYSPRTQFVSGERRSQATEFRRGHRTAPATEFKPGQSAHNRLPGEHSCSDIDDLVRLTEHLDQPKARLGRDRVDWMSLATVIYGARGSGKTSLGAVMAEEVTKARQRFCAVDLKGDWYGLKSTADGKGDGIPVVVFGGDHQDVPLEDGSGAFIGETVAGLDQSCILDLEYLSKGKQVRFLAAFFEKLYDTNRTPLLLLLDEAQRYAPQRPIDPDAAKCLGAVEDLVKLGRKHGIGPVLFTQRGSGLNKEVSELCDMMVAFRTPGPLDQDRIKDWLDANTTKAERDKVMGQLSGLPTGTAVFASGHPDMKTFGVFPVRRRETFDSSATPKVGQRKIEPKQLAKPDLEKLREKMAGAIERQKADDPRALRARIAELERELKAKPGAPAKAAPAPKPERVEVPMFDRAAFKELERAIGEQLFLATGNAKGLLHIYMSKCLESAGAKPGALVGAPRPAQALADAPPQRRMVVPGVLPPPAPPRLGTASDSPMSKMERKLLTALAQYQDGLTRPQVLTLAGFADAGRISTAFGRFRADGWMVDQGARMVITHAGLAALGSYERLPVGDELIQHWVDKLDQPAKALFRVLAANRDRELTRVEVLTQAKYADAGRISTAFGLLRRMKLMRDGDVGMALNEETFAS